MEEFVNIRRRLSSYGVKVVLMMLLVVPFTLTVYAQNTYWERLAREMNILYEREQYSEAANVAKEASKFAEEMFGSDHTNLALSLKILAEAYRE